MKPNLDTINRLLRILIGPGLIPYGVLNKNRIGAPCGTGNGCGGGDCGS